ncbi:MAG: cache sensor protein type 2 [Thermomicrobiales bacterium]|nr:cache sensor protein type 2 [Thermomicrobiales bacterium]
MSSHRTVTAALAFGLVLACAGTAHTQQNHATPQEVMQKVRQVAQDIAKAGEAGLATFSSTNTTSIWKDSYTFVVSCERGTAVTAAHPVRPELKGKPEPGGTQPTRKVSYLLAAQGTPYVVGAGIYDALTKIEDLNRLADGQP